MVSKLPLVAFNAHLASGAASYRSAGISAYIRNLLRHVPMDGALRYAVLVGKGAFANGERLPLRRSHCSTERPVARILWEQLALPGVLRRLGAAVLHAPAFVGPVFSSCPQIVTVHDLSFMRYPRFFRTGNRVYLRWMTRWSCRRAAAVIAVSRFTAREIHALLGIPEERIHVIYHGVAPRFRPLPAAEIARFRRAQALPERFILYLGTLEPRKNLITLVRAFAQAPDTGVHLILAGGRGWLYEQVFAEVERLGLAARVHFPGYIPEETQVLWVNAADVFAYLSHYEGFGLPVLEALACGTPTLTAATTSLPEAAGDGALLVSPDQVERVAAGLQRLLTDRQLRDTLRERGLAHASQFTWETTARQTVALYQRILIGEGQL